MYTIPWNPLTNAPSTTSVTRDADGASIPFDPGNVDYQAYLAWVAAGHTPTPATAPQAPVAAVITSSAQSLALAQAKALAASDDTAGALAALLNLMEP